MKTKSLINNPDLGSPTSYSVKKMTRGVKELAREFAADDPEFLAMIDRAIGRESATQEKRRVAMSTEK